MAVASPTPEAVQLVTDALKFGAAAYAAGVLERAGANAWDALVARLRERFGRRRDGNLILDRYIEDQGTWAAPLQKELQETEAFSDPQVMEAARQVVASVKGQIAAGKFNVQMGPGGQITQLIQGDHVYVISSGPAAPVPRPEKPMGLKAFEELVKPGLIRDGWEVSVTTPEKIDMRLAEGWEEVIVRAQDGARMRIVITAHGVTDAIPIQRNKLSPNAMKLLVAAMEHGGRGAHALFFKEFIGPDSPQFGVDDLHVQGADAEYVREELLGYDLISERSPNYYVLTGRGRDRAEQLRVVGFPS